MDKLELTVLVNEALTHILEICSDLVGYLEGTLYAIMFVQCMTTKSELSLANMETIRSGRAQRSYIEASAWHQSQESSWSQARLALKVQEFCRSGR